MRKGLAVDGDGRSYSPGSTLVQSAGRSWNVTLRDMQINIESSPNPNRSLSATPIIVPLDTDRIRTFTFRA